LYSRFISICLNEPKPEHFVQAPSGALKEKESGVILGYERSHFMQLLFSESNSSSLSLMIFTSPPDSVIASSISSVNLFLKSGVLTLSGVSLSMTKSILCFLFSSSTRSSTSSKRYVSLSIITLKNPLDNRWARSDLYCPFLFFINGETIVTFSVEPFSILSTFFVISCTVCDWIGSPQFGQCACPICPNNSRR
jgi:hypothetical protein